MFSLLSPTQPSALVSCDPQNRDYPHAQREDQLAGQIASPIQGILQGLSEPLLAYQLSLEGPVAAKLDSAISNCTKVKRNDGVIIFAALQLSGIRADNQKMTVTPKLSSGLNIRPASLTK